MRIDGKAPLKPQRSHWAEPTHPKAICCTKLKRVDVPHTESGFESGVTYGVAPGASAQVVPEGGAAPPALVSGEQYNLYVLFDVALPIARCIFTAP